MIGVTHEMLGIMPEKLSMETLNADVKQTLFLQPCLAHDVYSVLRVEINMLN